MMGVPDTATKIKKMEIRGAGKIAKAASEALREEAEKYRGKDSDEFILYMKKCGNILLDSRPTAVSLHNGIFLTLKDMEKGKTVPEIKKKIVSNSKKFVADSEKALKKISAIGEKLISDGDVILTHCNSQAALSVIIEAHRKKKNIKVYATESRPWGQGYISSAQLAEAGVDVTLIIDSCVSTVMDEVDKVFVGADTVTVKGELYNKIGTSQIAAIAKAKKKKFYVCCETYKFSPVFRKQNVIVEERDPSEITGTRKISGKIKVFNPVFDRTEPKYIDAIITEKGKIRPTDAKSLSVKTFGKEKSE